MKYFATAERYVNINLLEYDPTRKNKHVSCILSYIWFIRAVFAFKFNSNKAKAKLHWPITSSRWIAEYIAKRQRSLHDIVRYDINIGRIIIRFTPWKPGHPIQFNSQKLYYHIYRLSTNRSIQSRNVNSTSKELFNIESIFLRNQLRIRSPGVGIVVGLGVVWCVNHRVLMGPLYVLMKHIP